MCHSSQPKKILDQEKYIKITKLTYDFARILLVPSSPFAYHFCDEAATKQPFSRRNPMISRRIGILDTSKATSLTYFCIEIEPDEFIWDSIILAHC